MDEHKIYDPGQDGHKSVEEDFMVYRGSPPERDDSPGADVRQITNGLRVLDCFSPQRPTLTTDEISELLDLPEEDVTLHAGRLVDLGYLQANSSSGAGTWTLTADGW